MLSSAGPKAAAAEAVGGGSTGGGTGGGSTGGRSSGGSTSGGNPTVGWGTTTVSGPRSAPESGPGGGRTGGDSNLYPPFTVTGPTIKWPNGTTVGGGVTDDGSGASVKVTIPF